MDNDKKITITICGDGGTGKSSITLRVVRSQWLAGYDPTIEDSYSVTRTYKGHQYTLDITDTAGQEEYRGMFSSQNLHSDAFILVYDITQFGTLETLEYYSDLINIETDRRMDLGGVPPVKIVAGNKCDLDSRGLRQVNAQTGMEWAKLHGCGFMETSALNMVNVEETFQLIIQWVLTARDLHAHGYAVNTALLGHGSTPSSPTTATFMQQHGATPLLSSPTNTRLSEHNEPAVQLSGHAQAVTAPLTPLVEKGDAIHHHSAGTMQSGSDLHGSSGFYDQPKRWRRMLNYLRCW